MFKTAVILLSFILIPFTAKGESLFSGGGEMDFNSRYIWRGIALSENPVLNPSAWISAKDLTLNVWANIDLTDEPDRRFFNEVDATLSYEKEWGKFSFEPSFVIYTYPGQSQVPATGELALKIAYPFEPFALYTSQIVDVIEYPGAYFGEWGMSYGKEITPKWSWEGTVSLGIGSSRFNNAYLGVPINAVNVFSAGLSAAYAPCSHFSITPHVQLSALLDGELRNQVDDPTLFNAGLTFETEW